MALLEVKKLVMRFGGLIAVNQVDLAVEKGQIFSVIGPNGAGKTTVFNAITGIYVPTEGAILFQGRDMSRPLTWKVILACGLIGLVTGICSVLVGANVDKLWRAAIKRNSLDSSRPIYWEAVIRDGFRYLGGRPAADKLRNGRWAVVTADGRETLAVLTAPEDAARAVNVLEAWTADVGSHEGLVERGGKWGFLAPDGKTFLISFESREAAMERIARLRKDQDAARLTVWVGLLLGLALGSAGAYAVWKRARRTPDVIALGGIARTFQNIRLFQDMTVLENVLIGMDRSFRTFVPRMMVHTPGLRREEEQGERRAADLLAFVGLGSKANMLAKNLPYGDQRRLEIARALATEPTLLLLDEPAAGMNPAESSDLMKLIRKIRDTGITVLLIEHHMKVVMGISDRIAVLQYGLKIAEGTPEEIKKNPAVIEAYLGKEEVH